MITEKDLLEARRLSLLIENLEEEREHAYLGYTSPRYDGVKKTTPATDPTLKALNRIMRLDEKIDKYSDIFSDLQDKIFSEVEDITIRNIMQWFILGYDWKGMYKRTGVRDSREKMYRYLDNQAKKECSQNG